MRKFDKEHENNGTAEQNAGGAHKSGTHTAGGSGGLADGVTVLMAPDNVRGENAKNVSAGGAISPSERSEKAPNANSGSTAASVFVEAKNGSQSVMVAVDSSTIGKTEVGTAAAKSTITESASETKTPSTTLPAKASISSTADTDAPSATAKKDRRNDVGASAPVAKTTVAKISNHNEKSAATPAGLPAPTGTGSVTGGSGAMKEADSGGGGGKTDSTA